MKLKEYAHVKSPSQRAHKNINTKKNFEPMKMKYSILKIIDKCVAMSTVWIKKNIK